jgi:hypothetical protein
MPGDGIGRLILDIDAGLIIVLASLGRVPLAPARRPLGGEGPHVKALPQQVNAFQKREALHQPADAVVHREPGFLGRRVTVAPSPAADRLFEGGGKSTFSTIGIACHGSDCRWLLSQAPVGWR